MVWIVGKQLPGCQGKERKVAVDFVDITVFMASDEWATVIR